MRIFKKKVNLLLIRFKRCSRGERSKNSEAGIQSLKARKGERVILQIRFKK